VWNRVKNIPLKNSLLFSPQNPHCFPIKPIVFQHVHFFIPLFWNEKLSLTTRVMELTLDKANYSQNN